VIEHVDDISDDGFSGYGYVVSKCVNACCCVLDFVEGRDHILPMRFMLQCS